MSPSVDCLVGLQFGSEGKGAWAGRLAKYYRHSVRVGAPNAGHTVMHEGKAYKMRQIPCAWVNPDCLLYVGAGGLIDPVLLEKEIAMLPMDVTPRLFVDWNAGVLLPEDKEAEELEKFNQFNGSTAEGVGYALARKVLRKKGTVAHGSPKLAGLIANTRRALQSGARAGQGILLEGTQGYGLCLDHGIYPFVTSRNVLASSLLSDVGLAPKTVRHVLGVLRTYPIRVAGNSGPMGGAELTWDEVARRAGYEPGSINERTTVTNRVRRVSELSWPWLEEAVRADEPDALLVNFIDYIDAKLRGKNSIVDFFQSRPAVEFVVQLEGSLGVKVAAVSTGPAPEDVIYLDKWREMFQHEEAAQPLEEAK